jgi:rhamnulokinase
VLGRFDGRTMALEVVHRFANRSVRLPDGLHWDLLGLFADSLEGLQRVATEARLDGIGVDAWGVDYGLLDADLRLLGPPFHYRDARTANMIERVHARVDRDALYAVTGIQTMSINTVFQLLAEADSAALCAAHRIALVADLFALWLAGELVNEITAASTTGLLDARTGGWTRALIECLGLPARPFAIEPAEPGLRLGPALAAHAGLAGTPVWTVAGHDTASAFAATPLSGQGGAVLSSGTWSLLGLELERPHLGADAAAFNLTNERGLDGTTRLLRNVMGLWLLQECRRAWRDLGLPSDYTELLALAATARPDVAVFDPDADVLLAPGDMPARIAALCRDSGQPAPDGPGELVRSILVSLACKYRFVLERLERIGGAPIELLHVVGGGSQNALLCRLTADLTRVPVLAGPAEATALGNALVQARAAGEIGDSLAELREVAAASSRATSYEPGDAADAVEAYSRFLTVTGLDAERRTAALN